MRDCSNFSGRVDEGAAGIDKLEFESSQPRSDAAGSSASLGACRELSREQHGPHTTRPEGKKIRSSLSHSTQTAGSCLGEADFPPEYATFEAEEVRGTNSTSNASSVRVQGRNRGKASFEIPSAAPCHRQVPLQ